MEKTAGSHMMKAIFTFIEVRMDGYADQFQNLISIRLQERISAGMIVTICRFIPPQFDRLIQHSEFFNGSQTNSIIKFHISQPTMEKMAGLVMMEIISIYIQAMLGIEFQLLSSAKRFNAENSEFSIFIVEYDFSK